MGNGKPDVAKATGDNTNGVAEKVRGDLRAKRDGLWCRVDPEHVGHAGGGVHVGIVRLAGGERTDPGGHGREVVADTACTFLQACCPKVTGKRGRGRCDGMADTEKFCAPGLLAMIWILLGDREREVLRASGLQTVGEEHHIEVNLPRTARYYCGKRAAR